MIDFRNYTVFLVAALVVVAAAGPDIIDVLSRTISGGRRLEGILACGIASREVLRTILAVLGLAVLFQASTSAFLVVKYIGAAHLVYLGLRAIRERDDVALQAWVLRAT